MASLNCWQGIGNLGADPETRYTAGGDAVAAIRIACTETWKDRNTGEKKERTEWVRISFFGKLAEIVGKYLKKGSQVFVEGRLSTRKWQDQNGQDRYTTEIQADNLLMLGSPRSGSSDNGRSDYEPDPRQEPQRNSQGGTRPTFDDLGDDIPFMGAARGIAGHCYWG